MIQLTNDPQNRLGAQANAFRGASSARSEGQFGSPFVHRTRAAESFTPEHPASLISSALQFHFQLRLGNHPLRLALEQAMLTLCRAKEGRQHEAGHAFKQSSQIPENKFSTVVQCQCNDRDLLIAQSLLAIHHFSVERGVVQFQLIPPQGDGAGFLLSVAA